MVSLAGTNGSDDVVSDVKVYDYVYNGNSLTQLTITTTVCTSGTTVETLYFAYDGSSPMTVTYGDEVFYYVTNLQGDVIAILDDEGAAVVEYTYDAWGNILTTAGNMASTLGVANPLTYRGYVYDQESELYYLQSRFYNPEIGRFINADALVSTGQGMLGNNMFAYCRNNPVVNVDASGYIPRTIVFPVCLEINDNRSSIAGPYDSADDAAKAFCEYFYSSSLYIRHEFGADIYSVTHNGVTKYYFNNPRHGGPHDILLGYPIPEGATLVAYVHTHPNSNEFSPADKNVSRYLNCDAYVVGPNLTMQKYVLESDEAIPICSISLRSLSVGEKNSLLVRFSKSWYAHIAEGCEFFYCNCGKWPTP